MSRVPVDKLRSEKLRRRSTALLVGLTLALCLLHGWGIWQGFEGWKGISNGWPLWRDDHPLYFYSAVVTRFFLAQSGTTAGYDPAFMSGYPKSVVFPSSSTLPELVVAAFGASQPELAYKLYVLVSAALIPWLIAGSCALWRVGAGGTFLAVGLFLVYVWTDFPINYATLGMLPYLLAIPLGLLSTGVFVRYCESGRWWWWLASALLMSLAVMVHFTTAMIVAPAAAVLYGVMVLADRSRGPKDPDRLRWPRHVGVAALPLVVLGSNAFWWLPGLWLSGTKGRSDFAFSHPEGVLARLWQILWTEAIIELTLWPLGLVGLVLLLRRSRLPGWGLLAFTGAGFFWGYMASAFRSLDFLQPGRHTYAFYSGLTLAAGYALGRLFTTVRERGGVVAWLIVAVALGVGGYRVFRFPVNETIQSHFYRGLPFLTSRPSYHLLWVLSRVERYVKPGERLLYEEGGFFPRGVTDPFVGGRFSGLLAPMRNIELVGGPYLHASLETNFTQFGEGKFCGKPLSRDRFVRYARIYRPEAIFCWSDESRAFCKANPDLIEIKEEKFPFLVGRVKGFEGAAIVGKAEVEALPGKLRVTRAEGGLDGSVVLRYHSVPCLRSDPPVAWEPVFLEDDPVPFIKLLRPPPGAVTFELKIPPGHRGAPAR